MRKLAVTTCQSQRSSVTRCGWFGYALYDLMADVLPLWGETAGASACVLGVATLYALSFPKETVNMYGILRIPIWGLLLPFVLSDLFALFLQDHIPGINSAVHLGGVIFAFGYWIVFSGLARAK